MSEGSGEVADQSTKGPTVVAQLIQNQERYFAQCEETDPAWREWLTPRLGSPEDILKTLREVYTAHSIFKMFAVQPLSHPVGLVFNYKQTLQHAEKDEDTGEPVTTYRLELEETAVAAHTRSIRAHRMPTPGPFDQKELTDHFRRDCLTEALDQLLRELVGVLRSQAHTVAAAVGPPYAGLFTHGRNTVWRRTGRGAANRLVVSARSREEHPDAFTPVGGLPADTVVWVDPLLPPDEAIAWYTGQSPYDATLIWAPYCFAFCREDGTENPTRITFRHAYRVAYPGGSVLMRLPVPSLS